MPRPAVLPPVPPPLVLELIFHALSDPIRSGIVRRLLRDGECSCAALDGGRPKSTMSHHFRILRQAGLLRTRIDGTTHLNSLCRAELDAAFPGLLALLTADPDPRSRSGPRPDTSTPTPDQARGSALG